MISSENKRTTDEPIKKVQDLRHDSQADKLKKLKQIMNYFGWSFYPEVIDRIRLLRIEMKEDSPYYQNQLYLGIIIAFKIANSRGHPIRLKTLIKHSKELGYSERKLINTLKKTAPYLKDYSVFSSINRNNQIAILINRVCDENKIPPIIKTNSLLLLERIKNKVINLDNFQIAGVVIFLAGILSNLEKRALSAYQISRIMHISPSSFNRSVRIFLRLFGVEISKITKLYDEIPKFQEILMGIPITPG